MHRIFIGLSMPEKLRAEILEWEKQFQNLPVRWLAGKDLHVTLAPPFYVDDRKLEETGQSLQEVAGFGTFGISFSKVTFGPDSRRPRLIWAEGEATEELLNLQRKIYGVLGRLPEKRPFRLHLTIARFKPQDFSSFKIQKLNEKVKWEGRVDQVALFESTLSRGGAGYAILKEITL